MRHSALRDIGVEGTPTLLLVDESGKVIASWVGKLGPDQEAAVFARLKSLT